MTPLTAAAIALVAFGVGAAIGWAVGRRIADNELNQAVADVCMARAHATLWRQRYETSDDHVTTLEYKLLEHGVAP